MCTGASVYLGIASLVIGTATQISASKTQARNLQAQTDAQTFQYFRDLEMQAQQKAFAQQQFMMDMTFKNQQLQQAQQQFMMDYQFQKEMQAFEIMQQEAALEAANLSALSQLEYANDTMEAAWEAADTDMDLLNDQWEQTLAKTNLDIFERKRQAMKEQASIRVSQGESGIFGNTALKELANSVMQESWDSGVLKWNLGNEAKQLQAHTKKIKATAMSRTNEALSGVVNRYITGTAMNPAVAGAQV